MPKLSSYPQVTSLAPTDLIPATASSATSNITFQNLLATSVPYPSGSILPGGIAPNEYWVSTGTKANDANTGDKYSPFNTIAKAISVAHAASQASIIHLGYGTFTISAQQTISFSTVFEGMGEDLTTIQGANSTNIAVLFQSVAGGITFRNLTIDGNAANNTNNNSDTTQIGVEMLPNSSAGVFLRLTNVTVQNFWGHGTRCIGTSTNPVTVNIGGTVTLSNNGRSGALFTYCTQIIGSNIVANNNGNNTGNFVGIDLDRCTNVALSNIIANGNSGSGVSTSPSVGSMKLAINTLVANGNGTGGAIGYGLTISVAVQYLAIGTIQGDSNLSGAFAADVTLGSPAGGFLVTDMIPVYGSVGSISATNNSNNGVWLNHVANLSIGQVTTYNNIGSGVALAACYHTNIGAISSGKNTFYGIAPQTPSGNETYNGVATSPGYITIGRQDYYNNGTGNLKVDPGYLNCMVDTPAYASVTISSTIKPDQGLTSVNAAGATTQTLPDPRSVVGTFTIQAEGGGTVTLATVAATTIAGAATQSIVSGSCMTVRSVGTSDWKKVG